MEKNEDKTAFLSHVQTDSKILTNKPDETGALKAAFWHGKQRETGKNKPFLYKIWYFFHLFRYWNLFFQAIFCRETYNVFTQNKQGNDRKHTTCPPNAHFPAGWDIHSRLLPAPFIFSEKAGVSTKAPTPSFCQQKQTKQNKVSRRPNKRIPTIPPYTPGQIFSECQQFSKQL